MKNRKTSYSLSKLASNQHQYQRSSRGSKKKLHHRNANQSQIERTQSRTQLQHRHNEAVRNQYYGTAINRLATSEQDSDIFQSDKRVGNDKIAKDIQQKMRRVIENYEYETDFNMDNVVFEESQVDADFENQINENRNMLKIQREQNGFNQSQSKHLYTQSQHQSPQNIQPEDKYKQQSKKLSLIKGKVQRPVRKLKTKSLLPSINAFSSKLLQVGQERNNQSSVKPQKFKSRLKGQNIESLPNIKKIQYYNIQNALDHKNDERFKRKLTEVTKKKQDKKLTQLKLQSRIEELKSKIAMRTSPRENKFPDTKKHQDTQPRKKHARYSSHSVFDHIQDFLSNPHENSSKSQRKFMKLYQKINDDDQVFQQQLQLQKQKIQKLEAKIRNQSHEKDANTIQMKEKIQRLTSTGSDPLGQIDSQYGSLQWRRLQKSKLQQSNFQKELKYVRSLQAKGIQNLKKYIQNQKILHELKMLKKTQQMASKTSIQHKISLDKHISL